MLVLGSKILAYVITTIVDPLVKIFRSATASRTTSGAFSLSATLGAAPTAAVVIGGKTGTGSSLGIGMTNGTNAYSVYGRSRDSQNPTNVRVILSNTKVYQALSKTANTVESAISVTNFTEDTLNLSFDSTPEVQTDLIGLLLNLENVDLTYHEFTGATTVITKTGLAFEPNLFISFTMPHNVIGSGVVGNHYVAMGLAISAANQCSINFGDVNNITPSEVFLRLSDSKLSHAVATDQTIALTSVTSDGYVITRSSSTGSSTICILAARLETPVSLSIQDTPTTTGTHLLDIGIAAKQLFFIMSLAEAANTTYTDAKSQGLAFGTVNSGDAYSYGIVSTDGSTASDSESYFSSSVLLRSAIGTTALNFAHSDDTVDGPELTWTNVTGTAKKMIVLGIEESEAPSSLVAQLDFSNIDNSQYIVLEF